MQRLDESGFDRLYVDHYPSMLAYARNFVTPEDAEEVVQDVMVWLWENRKTVRINSSFKGYLFRSVRNSCMNRLTQGLAKQRLHQSIFGKIQPFYEDADLYTVDQLSQKIEDALNRLPENYRTVFEKNRFEDMTYPLIAEELGISVKSVEYRMSQALKQLRTELKDYLPLIIAFLGQ
ncbi:MAG: RNA polymerase sigma-70 factor [Bacteroidales bacterium]|nr:RNA polymerase sigma-70 factor [Bacteroidales bacterium]